MALWSTVVELEATPEGDWLPEGVKGAFVRILVEADSPVDVERLAEMYLGPLARIVEIPPPDHVTDEHLAHDSELHELSETLASVPRSLVFGTVHTYRHVGHRHHRRYGRHL
jgi:hypothetical protein